MIFYRAPKGRQSVLCMSRDYFREAQHPLYQSRGTDILRIYRGADILHIFHDAPSPRRTSTNIYRHSLVRRAQIPNPAISIMKRLLLPIFTRASAVAGISYSGDLPPWMYVSTVTSDTYITVPCTGRPLPINCEENSWTDTTVTLTLTKGRTYIHFPCSIQPMLHNAYPSYSRLDPGRL
jgi:hypothetical protein